MQRHGVCCGDSILWDAVLGLHLFGDLAGQGVPPGHLPGCRVEAFEETGLRLRQGRTSLEVALTGGKPAPLLAPDRGGMARSIHEHVSSPARFRLEAGGRVLFDLYSPRASFEHA